MQPNSGARVPEDSPAQRARGPMLACGGACPMLRHRRYLPPTSPVSARHPRPRLIEPLDCMCFKTALCVTCSYPCGGGGRRREQRSPWRGAGLLEPDCSPGGWGSNWHRRLDFESFRVGNHDRTHRQHSAAARADRSQASLSSRLHLPSRAVVAVRCRRQRRDCLLRSDRLSAGHGRRAGKGQLCHLSHSRPVEHRPGRHRNSLRGWPHSAAPSFDCRAVRLPNDAVQD